MILLFPLAGIAQFTIIQFLIYFFASPILGITRKDRIMTFNSPRFPFCAYFINCLCNVGMYSMNLQIDRLVIIIINLIRVLLFQDCSSTNLCK